MNPICSAPKMKGNVVCSAPMRGDLICLAPIGGELVCSPSTQMGEVVCSAPLRGEVLCLAPNMEEVKLADNIGMERKENEENLHPEGWSQQIGDEDLLHPEGRDWEELDKLREAWDCDNCGDNVQDILNEDCRECWEGVSYEQLEHALLGLDVVGLIPALQSKPTGEIVRKMLIKSGIKVSGMNWKQACRYIAMNRHLTGSGAK